MKPRNPYKRKGAEVPTRQIIGSVGQEDYEYLFLRAPHRGNQDAVIGHLFKSFVTKLRELNLPPCYLPENNEHITNILQGYAGLRVDQDRSGVTDGRTEKRTDSGSSRTKDQPTSETV